MRRRLAFILAVVVNGWLFVPPGQAQRGGPTASGSAEPDLFRPYGSRSPSSFTAGRSGYTRPRTIAPPRRPPEVAPPPQPRGLHDYFPTMRPGQGPNHNTVDPRTLCVPGRRALIMRGR
jgi:hypothetical protein